jgi:hypothetical protein
MSEKNCKQLEESENLGEFLHITHWFQINYPATLLKDALIDNQNNKFIEPLEQHSVKANEIESIFSLKPGKYTHVHYQWKSQGEWKEEAELIDIDENGLACFEKLEK